MSHWFSMELSLFSSGPLWDGVILVFQHVINTNLFSLKARQKDFLRFDYFMDRNPAEMPV